MSEQSPAVLYRMVLPEHTCPYGVKAKSMLQQSGFDIDDRAAEAEQEGANAHDGGEGPRATAKRSADRSAT